MPSNCFLPFFLFIIFVNSIHFTNAQCSGTITLISSFGSFDDGSGASSYTNSLNCAWLIQPSGAIFVELNITSFSTESNYDFVTIYDGSDASAPILSGPFSGSLSNIPVIYSTTGSVYVRFTTDSGGTAAGWNINYAGRSGSPPTCSGMVIINVSE